MSLTAIKAREMTMPVTEKSMREREGEILDQLALGQISKSEAVRQLTECHQDFYAALAIVSEAERSK